MLGEKQLHLEPREESESVVDPGVVEGVVRPLHATKVDWEAAAENVAEMRGCVCSNKELSRDRCNNFAYEDRRV